MSAIQQLCKALRGEASGASRPKEIVRVLEHALQEMLQLDAGMLHGQIVSGPSAQEARQALAQVADEIFGKLCTSAPERARDWLGELPTSLRPKGVNLAAWRQRLDVSEDRTTSVRTRIDANQQRIERLVAERGGDPREPLGVEQVERVFQARLPRELRRAWQEALEGGPNELRFLTERLRSLLVTAQFITDEQTRLELISEAVEGKPFPVIPIAEGLAPSDYFVLSLGDPVEPSDYRVLLCQHDAVELGATYASSVEWIRKERPVAILLGHLREALDASGPADLGDDDERLSSWCHSVIRDRAPELARDEDSVNRALQRFFDLEEG